MQTTVTTNSYNLFKAQLHSALGNHKYALELVNAKPELQQKQEQSNEEQDSQIENSLVSSLLHLNIGQYQESINILLPYIDQSPPQYEYRYAALFLASKSYFLNHENEKAILTLYRVREILNFLKGQEPKQTWIEEALVNVEMMIKKVQMEQKVASSIGDINNAAYMPKLDRKGKPVQVLQENIIKPKLVLPPIDKKYTYFQNSTHLFITYKVNNSELAKQAEIKIYTLSIEIDYKNEKGEPEHIELKLANAIDSDASSFEISQSKIEIKVKKVSDNIVWMSVEKGGPQNLVASTLPKIQPGVNTQPSYPSSSKTGQKDWNKIDREIEKELQKEKPEGDAAMNTLFKQIYDRSDEDTRRAMIKSYQTSGGTVLSTNWGEVKEKDYEGKDKVDPPEGQKWAEKD